MTGAFRSLLHGLAALLLAFAIVSPALAELACSQDTAAHLAQADDVDTDHAFIDGDPDGHDASPDPDGHCAFSHSHCGGIPAAMIAPARMQTARAFVPLPTADFTSFRLRGPERPPRA